MNKKQYAKNCKNAAYLAAFPTYAAAKADAKAKADAAKLKSAIRQASLNGSKALSAPVAKDLADAAAEVFTGSRGIRPLDKLAVESFPGSRPLALGEFVSHCYGISLVVGKGGHCDESRPVCNEPRKLNGVQVGNLLNADGSKSKRLVVFLKTAGKASDNAPEWGLQSSDNGATWQVAIRASDAAWTHKKRLLPVPFNAGELAFK